MNLSGIVEPTTLNRVKARQQFVEYKRVIESGKGTKLDEKTLDVLRQVKMGRRIINLQTAMQSGGIHPNGHPVLAVANALAKWTWFVWDDGKRTDSDGNWYHPVSAFYSNFDVNPGWRSKRRFKSDNHYRFRFLRDTFTVRLPVEIRARVPTVPPNLRPKTSLSNYVILWEANWDSAPRDPILLRRVTGNMFVIMAEWDLTEIERSVIQESILTGNG